MTIKSDDFRVANEELLDFNVAQFHVKKQSDTVARLSPANNCSGVSFSFRVKRRRQALLVNLLFLPDGKRISAPISKFLSLIPEQSTLILVRDVVTINASDIFVRYSGVATQEIKCAGAYSP